MFKKIFVLFYVLLLSLNSINIVYAENDCVFHSSPKGYPKSVVEGIELANEYVSKRLFGFDDKNLFYPEWMVYRVFENNKETIGNAYLNNMYGFGGVPQDRRLPNELAGRPLTNNVMENLLIKIPLSSK